MFGIMVYELVAGYTPFFGYDEYTTIEKIVACKVTDFSCCALLVTLVHL